MTEVKAVLNSKEQHKKDCKEEGNGEGLIARSRTKKCESKKKHKSRSNSRNLGNNGKRK